MTNVLRKERRKNSGMEVRETSMPGRTLNKGPMPRGASNEQTERLIFISSTLNFSCRVVRACAGPRG